MQQEKRAPSALNINLCPQHPNTCERKAGLVIKRLTWDLGELGLVLGATTDSLCEWGQIT